MLNRARQHGSMACSEENPGISQSETKQLLVRNLSEVLDDLQGSVYFDKKLSATNAQRSPRLGTSRKHGQLSFPRWFVNEHGNKFRRAVVLRSDLSCNKSWPHRLSFCTSRLVPEVIFAGSRWGAFVTAHGLVKDDHIVFSLTAMSQFQVYMFNELGDPKGHQVLHTPLNWSEEIKRSQQKAAIPKPLAYYCKSEPEDVSMVNKMSTGMCTTNRVEIEDEIVGCSGSNNNAPVCQNSSYNNKLSQLLVEQEFHAIQTGASCHPSFLRRLVPMNVYRLEIPKHFVSTYRSQLNDPVQLQGIHEDSPVQNDVHVVSYFTADGHERLYLNGSGWDDFVNGNDLRFGQELVFTLTADSCFTVREEISWNPRTGLNLGSRVSLSVSRKLH